MLKAGADIRTKIAGIRVGLDTFIPEHDARSLIQMLRSNEACDIDKVSEELTELEEEIDRAYKRAQEDCGVNSPLLPLTMAGKISHIEVPAADVGDASTSLMPPIVPKASKKQRLKSWLRR